MFPINKKSKNKNNDYGFLNKNLNFEKISRYKFSKISNFTFNMNKVVPQVISKSTGAQIGGRLK